MSEDTQEMQQEQEVNPLEAVVQDLKGQLDAVKGKNTELLGKMKKYQENLDNAYKEAEIEKKQELEKAGEFEQLYKSALHEKESVEAQLKQFQDRANAERKQNVATKIAAEIANPRDVENLSFFVAQRLNEDGSKVLDSEGQLTVSSYDQLKQEFLDSERYASMLKGNQSSGGNAPGASGNAPSNKISRDKWESMGALEQDNFLDNGGTVID